MISSTTTTTTTITTTEEPLLTEDGLRSEPLKQKTLHDVNMMREKELLQKMWEDPSSETCKIYRTLFQTFPSNLGWVLKSKSIERTLTESEKGSVICSNTFDSLSVESFRRLFSNEHLNDELINWYLGSLHEEGIGRCVINFLTTYWFNTSINYVPPSMTYLEFCPLIVGPCWWPNHWGFIGYDKVEQKGFWGDSLNSYELTHDHKQRFVKILQKLKLIENQNENFLFQRIEMTRQRDNWSCGVHLLMTLRRMSQKKDIRTWKENLSVVKFKAKFIHKIIEDSFGIISP